MLNGFSHEVLRLTEPSLSSRAWAVGKYYSLTPVHHSYAFHPKVVLLVGDNVELFVGSGNLEPGGMRGNLELFHRLESGSEDSPDNEVRSVVTDVWRYIKTRVAIRVPRFVSLQLDKIEGNVPWLKESQSEVGTTRFIAGPDRKVIPLIREVVGKDKVDTLYILSPFFDSKLQSLAELQSELRPKRIVLALQSETVSIPGDLLKTIEGLEVYELGDVGSRYAHAKVLVAECHRNSVLFAGSHNVSSRAFEGKNYEASILRVSSNGIRFSDLLGIADLVKHGKPIDLSAARMRYWPEATEHADSVRSLLIGAQLDGNNVEVEVRKPLNGEYTLIPYSQRGVGEALDVLPSINETRMTFRLNNAVDADRWIAVAIETGTIRSLPVPLLHVGDLLAQGSPTPEQRLRARFNGGLPELYSVEDILIVFQSLLLEGQRFHNTVKKAAPEPEEARQKAEVKQLSYEDFIIPWEIAEVSSQTNEGVRQDLDLMIHAIASALGETKLPPLPLKSTAQTDLFPDQSLARTSDFAQDLEDKDLELESQLGNGVELPVPKPAESQTSQSAKDGPAAELLEWERNKRLRNLLHKIMKTYPHHLQDICNRKGVLPFEILGQIASAGHLITSMLGRRKRFGVNHFDLVGWDDWTKFNVAILQILSNSENRFLQRFPWAQSTFEFHFRTLQKFITYLAILHALSKNQSINDKDRARLLIGLFRVSRIMGIEKSEFDEETIVRNVHQILGSTIPALKIPKLDWSGWTAFVERATEIDTTLRRKFKSAANIADSGQGNVDFELGDWIWWPHVDGHIGVVLAVGGSNIEVAHEPLTTTKVAIGYVVKMDI